MRWHRRRSPGDFSEEIHAHLAHEADEIEAQGATRRDAEAEAHRLFGNVLHTEEAFYERRRWMIADQFGRDLRHALRVFWRRPGFSAVVVLTLGLGIGANAAIFGVINAVLLRPLPYREPSRLAMIWTEDTAHDIHEGRLPLFTFSTWKERSRTFAGMTMYAPQTFLLGHADGSPDRMRSARVDANFFPLLGVEPLLGRVFTVDEESRRQSVSVLSYGLWRRLGGSAQLLGTDITMDGRKSRVIGVMPASFQFPFDDTQLWEPMTAHPYWATRDQKNPRSSATWYALGRARPDATWAQAQAEMNGIARHVRAENPDPSLLPDVRVVPLHVQTTGSMALPLTALFGAVILLLLIACTNVANLLLARGSARDREFAVRRALGAGRLRLAAQLLTESLVPAIAGGVLGLALAAVALKALIAFGPEDIPRLADARIDPLVLGFTLVLCLFAASASALWPAVRTGTMLGGGGRSWNTIADRRIQHVLMIGEFSIALVLLTGAGLMVRSFVRLQQVTPGFQPDKLLAARIDLHVGRTRAQQLSYFREAVDRAQSIPGVRSAAAVSNFLHSDPEDAVVVEGRLPQRPGPSYDFIEGPFLETAGIPLRRGRVFSNEDGVDSIPVAIVNDTMARTYWPGENAIGKRFRFPDQNPERWITVVGIAGDVHRQGREKAVSPQAFLPNTQGPENMMDVIVRTASDPARTAATLRHDLQAIDKTVAQFTVTTVEHQLTEQTAQRRFQTSLISVFSALSLLLAAIGIYGVMHYVVAQRTNEIGVRMALGAQPHHVLAQVVRQGLTLAGIGVGAGLVGAVGTTRLLASLLYGVTPTDPLTFASASLILLSVAALACWIPARRAARIDPLLALRQD